MNLGETHGENRGMNLRPLPRDQVRSVIEGRGAAPRVPILLHFWTNPEQFGDRKESVDALLARFPQDVQALAFQLPGMHEGPERDPGYRWLSRAAPQGGGGLDAQVLISDWSQLDEVLADFPDPRSPFALPAAPTPDGRYRLAFWWYCLFERHWSLRGMTNALMNFYTDSGQVHRLYRGLTDFYLVLMERAQREWGADGIFTSDDIGMQTGPFFRQTIFDEFFAPYYGELVEKAHALGMHFWLHACGNIEPFLSRLIDLGLDVIHPIQKYTMDEREIARRYGGRICVWAGFDVQRIIPFGSPQEVHSEVRLLMDTWHRPEGRMMFTAGNAINGDCPLSSLEALYEEAYGYGGSVSRRK